MNYVKKLNLHWFCTENHILEPFSVRRAYTKSYVTSEPYPRASQICCQNVRESWKKKVIKCRGKSFARCRVIVQNVEGGGLLGPPPSLFRVNPILTGGGGVNLTPPCTKSATASRPPQIATRLFMTFFFQVLRIFWYQVCENRTVGREVTRRFVLARRHKICPKSAFCIGLCTKHMEITDFLKMH